MLPKGFLVGNLTSDPQSGVAQASQNNYSRISVACSDIYVKQNSPAKSHFFNCTAWGKRAQFVQNFLKKGDKVFLEFTLSTSSYTAQDGRVIKSTDLYIDNIEVISYRSGSSYVSGNSSQQKNEETLENNNSVEDDELEEGDDDGITWDDLSVDF